MFLTFQQGNREKESLGNLVTIMSFNWAFNLGRKTWVYSMLWQMTQLYMFSFIFCLNLTFFPEEKNMAFSSS